MVFESLNALLWGDVEISCYHVRHGYVKQEANRINKQTEKLTKPKSDKIPIFRICFHTGFLSKGGQMQRLKKEDLDFACEYPSMPISHNNPVSMSSDFKVDLILSSPSQDKERPGELQVEERPGVEDFIFPSDFSGLIGMSEMHIVKPSNEYLFLLSEYLRLQREQNPKRSDVNEKVRAWVLKRCNNKLDPAISLLEKMPQLHDELVRMEDRLYIMGFPWKYGKTPKNKGMEDAIRKLREEMGEKFLVWNLSGEDKFDYSTLDHQVVSYDLEEAIPGLAFMLKLCHGMRYWLSLDKQHVVVLLYNEYEDLSKKRYMTLNGRTRAALVYSCFKALDQFNKDLEMFGSAVGSNQVSSMTSAQAALDEFAMKRNISRDEVDDMRTKPSFKRLVNDFDVNIRAGLFNAKPLVLHRLFLHRSNQGVQDTNSNLIFEVMIDPKTEREVKGCRPIMEVHNNGSVIYSTLKAGIAPVFVDSKEGKVIKFHFTGSDGRAGVTVLGDVIITCYHVALKKQLREENLPGLGDWEYNDETVDKDIIFQYTFNTGFVHPGPFRLHRSDLDILPVS